MAKEYKRKTLEEERREIDKGEAEDEVYSEAGREDLMEDEDEITDLDEGFMKGYDEGSKMAKCPICKEVLEDDFVEREIDGEIYRFCSDEHAEKFMKKHRDHKEYLEAGKTKKESKSDELLEDIDEEKEVLEETE